MSAPASRRRKSTANPASPASPPPSPPTTTIFSSDSHKCPHPLTPPPLRRERRNRTVEHARCLSCAILHSPLPSAEGLGVGHPGMPRSLPCNLFPLSRWGRG